MNLDANRKSHDTLHRGYLKIDVPEMGEIKLQGIFFSLLSALRRMIIKIVN
jgi:hypothetical protein